MDSKLSIEEQVYPQMEAFLFANGLQITLKTLVDALDIMIVQRGPSLLLCQITESLRGIHAGYLRRSETEEFKEDLKNNQLAEARKEIQNLKSEVASLNEKLYIANYNWK